MNDTIEQRPVVIVGAGVSGLSLAVLLAERGVPVAVIEKEPRPGGLARSFRYEGFTFDIGPHRFHTTVPEVDGFLRAALGAGATEIERRSLLHFRGHFYPWPLHPSYVLLRFPPAIALAMLRDLFLVFSRPEPVTFRDQIVNMYGETLYRHFFEGYSTKFLGIAPEQTHPDWARTGVDRAIIDERLKMRSLWQLIWRTARPGYRPHLRFLYPAGGCDRFIDDLAKRLERAGGLLRCGSAVEALETKGGRVRALRAGKLDLEPSLLVWTGTLHSLADGLGLPGPRLSYLSLLCYNLMLAGGPPFGFQWCYHGSPDVVFSRVSAPAEFCAGNTPTGRRSLCVEVTCREGDRHWSDPAALVDRLVCDLQRERLISTGAEVLDVRIERIPWAYPIYSLDYRTELDAFRRRVQRLSNVLLAGRLGRFWYNNMDHCIEASLALAREIEDRLLDERAGA